MYLIWSIINSAFIILFVALLLTLLFKGKELFNNRYGNLILMFLAIGILGMLNKDAYNPKNEYVFPIHQEFVVQNTKDTRVKIADNLTFDIGFTVRFKKDTTGEFIPVFSRSHTSGFTAGLVWKYKYADVDKIGENKFTYTVNGILEWHLFGIRVYSQEKEFKGELVLES